MLQGGDDTIAVDLYHGGITGGPGLVDGTAQRMHQTIQVIDCTDLHIHAVYIQLYMGWRRIGGYANGAGGGETVGCLGCDNGSAGFDSSDLSFAIHSGNSGIRAGIGHGGFACGGGQDSGHIKGLPHNNSDLPPAQCNLRRLRTAVFGNDQAAAAHGQV